MKKIKRIIVIMLVLSFLVSAFIVSAATNSGACGDLLKWSFDEQTGVLTITGRGSMWASASGAFNSFKDEVTDIVFPEGITRINGFINFDKLNEVILPNSVTSIAQNAFTNCTQLRKVTLSTNLTDIGYQAFYGCENLKTVYNKSPLNILKGSFDYGYVAYYADTVIWDCDKNGICGQNLSWSFSSKDCVLKITGTGATSDYYYNMNQAPWYYLLDSVTEVHISNGVTGIGDYAFYNFSKLTNAIIPESVTYLSKTAFSECPNLTLTVTEASYAHTFAQQNGIRYVTVSPCTHSMTEIRNAVSATCTDSGYSGDIYCLYCATIIACGETVPASHIYNTTVTAPTCTAEGYTKYSCINCDYSYIDNYLEMIQHNYGDWSVSLTPTCTKDGKKVRFCVTCNHLDTDIIPASHEYSVVAQMVSSCDKNGYVVYKCDMCGEVAIDNTSAIGHKFAFSHQENSTYTEPAKNVYICETCGKEGYIHFGYALCDFDKNGFVDSNDYDIAESEGLVGDDFDFDGDGELTDFDIAIIKNLTNGREIDEIIDINGDGKSNVKDLVRAKKIMAGYIPETDENSDADRDLDGVAGADDAVFVRKFILYVDLNKYDL